MLMVDIAPPSRKKKKKTSHKQRWFIAVGVVVVLLMAGTVYGVWLVGQQGRGGDIPSVDVPEEIQKEVQGLSIVVDTDMAQQYATYIASNDPDTARKVFYSRVAAESDAGDKAELLEQQVSLAIEYDQQDHAEAVATQLIEVRPDHDSYAVAARVYMVSGDYDTQIQHLKKAISAAQASDDENKTEHIRVYEERQRAAEFMRNLLKESADEA